MEVFSIDTEFSIEKIFLSYIKCREKVIFSIGKEDFWDFHPCKYILYLAFERLHIATDKALFSSEKSCYLSYFSMKTYVVGTH